MGSGSCIDTDGNIGIKVICSGCGKEKDLEDFSIEHKPTGDYRRKTCKQCRTRRILNYRAPGTIAREKNREAMKKWREENCDEAYWKERYANLSKERRSAVVEASKKSRARNRLYVQEAKRGPCVDCGKTFDPDCMDFDHIASRGEKLFNVGNLGGSACSIELIKTEILKCDLVCACCHRLRTKQRRSE